MGAGFEAYTWGLSMATEASQFCAELEKEFRSEILCNGLGMLCFPQKAFES